MNQYLLKESSLLGCGGACNLTAIQSRRFMSKMDHLLCLSKWIIWVVSIVWLEHEKFGGGPVHPLNLNRISFAVGCYFPYFLLSEDI